MASTFANFKVYEDEFFDGMYEYVTQNLNAFNGASNGAIRLLSALQKGNYTTEAFFQDIAGLIVRRDTTSTAAAAVVGPNQDENIAVKLNGRVGPVEVTVDALKKIGLDSREFSYMLGQQVGAQKTAYQLNSAIGALVAAGGTAGYSKSATTGTITHTNLVDTLAMMGDASNNVVCFVMHSKPYFDLVKQSITDKIFEVASYAIYSGSPITFGRPVVVTDCAYLLNATPDPDQYTTLALTTGAATVNESEKDTVVSDIVTGLDSLVLRVQGEFAYTLGVKGFKWKTATGINPTIANVTTTSNWVKTSASVKSGPGIALITQ